jgi:hypothetical protein
MLFPKNAEKEKEQERGNHVPLSTKVKKPIPKISEKKKKRLKEN